MKQMCIQHIMSEMMKWKLLESTSKLIGEDTKALEEEHDIFLRRSYHHFPLISYSQLWQIVFIIIIYYPMGHFHFCGIYYTEQLPMSSTPRLTVCSFLLVLTFLTPNSKRTN